MREPLLKKITADINKSSLNAVAKKIGLKQPTLYRIINDQSRGDIETWEKIEAYYRNKRLA